MLKDVIEKQKKSQGGLIPLTGACRYCGQIAQIEGMPQWDEDTTNEAAAELCDCIQAKIYTKKKRQKENAREAIDKQFGQQAEENETEPPVIELLETVADMVVEDRISSATIDIGDGLKAKISITSKGYIKVERTKTEKTTQEA